MTRTSSGRARNSVVEVAEDDRRRFGEVDDGVEQFLVFAPARAGDGASGIVEGFADGVLALGVAGQDAGGAQLGARIRRARRAETGAGGQDSMSARGAAGGDAAEFEGDDLVVEQGDEPAHGTDEALGLAGTPVHVLGPVEGGDLLGDEFGEEIERGAAFFDHVGGEVFALGRGGRGERFERDSGFFGEGDGGLGGLSVLVGMGGGGAEKLLGNVGLRGGEAADEDGDAARRGEGFGGGVSGGSCRQTRRSRVTRSLMRRCNSAVAEAIMRAGISSVPISNRKSDMRANASF